MQGFKRNVRGRFVFPRINKIRQLDGISPLRILAFAGYYYFLLATANKIRLDGIVIDSATVAIRNYQLPLLPPPSKLPPLPEKLLLFDELPKEELELRIGLLGDGREELVATSFPSVAKE